MYWQCTKNVGIFLCFLLPFDVLGFVYLLPLRYATLSYSSNNHFYTSTLGHCQIRRENTLSKLQNNVCN